MVNNVPGKDHYDRVREELLQSLSQEYFDDEEKEAILRDIESLDKRYRRKTLALCASLAAASSSLIPRALKRIRKASRSLPPRDMERWVSHAFDLLESQGISPFLDFLSRNDEEALNEFRGGEGLLLAKVAPRLETYLRGISGMELKIAPSEETYTDSETLFLPPLLGRYAGPERNLLYLKLMAIYQWAFIAGGSLDPGEDLLKPYLRENGDNPAGIMGLFRLFDDERLAVDLYTVIECIRLGGFVKRELPGLFRETSFILQDIHDERPSLSGLSGKTAFVEGLYRYFLTGRMRGTPLQGPVAAVAGLLSQRPLIALSDSLELLFSLYRRAESLGGPYEPHLFPVPGTIRPERIAAALDARRQQLKKRLEQVISRIINMPDVEWELHKKKLDETQVGLQVKKEGEYLQLKGRLFEVDDDLKEIVRETPSVSEGVLIDGDSVKEGSAVFMLRAVMEDEDVSGDDGGIRYDEWDYRRGDYKSGWCTLIEKEIPPVDDPFVEMTRRRYGGYIKTLRRKFELLKKDLKILRRQKDGDDVDIDAIVEAFSDLRAGLSPSQNLFVKRDRQERDIAALFLIDVSGSTKGWVNRAEKEALVLMCEALESLGDRYAIYGFSGMTRAKCEYYRVKSFDEPYNETVKQRIAGIVPKDYTRMGAPIRHSTGILKTVDAKIKLLVTLSDGRPEDRDIYRGDYGIEDTRKALTEAKEQGVQPFCITIDKEASSYLPHLFGEVNYIVLDDVRKLPNKITDIYRKLTT